MSRFPSLPLFTDAYIADTQHLSCEEHGAYLLLLMLAWRSPDCHLPADDARLARMLRLTPKKWASIKPTVMAFWTLENGFWTQKRLTKEHAYVSEKVEKNRDNGKLGGRPKSLKSHDPPKANGSPEKTERLTQTEPKPKAPTPTPTQVPSETTSLQDASAEITADPSPALSLKDQLWIEGKSSLIGMGVKDAKAGSMIGKWLRDTAADAGRILWAIDEARRTASGDPIPYVTRLLSNSPTTQRGRSNGAPSRDGIATLLRDLEGRTHERSGDHDGGGSGRTVPGDRAPDEPRSQRPGGAWGPVLDLKPIRSDRG